MLDEGDTPNKPLEWTGRHRISASVPLHSLPATQGQRWAQSISLPPPKLPPSPHPAVLRNLPTPPPRDQMPVRMKHRLPRCLT